MRNKSNRWVWCAVLVAVVVGLFAPSMTASAGPIELEEPTRCVVPVRR